MSIYSFVLSACNGRFDTRHLMVAGCGAMTALCLTVSDSALKAKSIGQGNNYALTSPVLKTISAKNFIMLPSAKPTQVNSVVASVKLAPKTVSALRNSSKLTIVHDNLVENVSLVSDLERASSVSEFSSKQKESCSVEAAKAAANGDRSKISPCVQALLSGDESAMADMPRKMADFFIEAMNDPNRAENAPANMINSMLAMMDAMTTNSDSVNKKPVITEVSVSKE